MKAQASGYSYQAKNMIYLCLFVVLSFFIQSPEKVFGAEYCVDCHLEEQRFSPFHLPEKIGCVICHGGNPKAKMEKPAHQNMDAYPGRMETVEKRCGQKECHAEVIPIVRHSIMNSLEGMISLTRRFFDQKNKKSDQQLPLHKRLSQKGPDSYLRKLCVSCHIGNERKNHLQSMRDRGGGCSSCHLKIYPQPEKRDITLTESENGFDHVRVGIHPTLTLEISNERCFGCHSRSGRIALNYVGLAETEKLEQSRIEDFGYLPDNRLVEKKSPDVHSSADMACIDCHTVTGVMGGAEKAERQKDQLDIQCNDCHGETLQTKSVAKFNRREAVYLGIKKRHDAIDSDGNVFVTQKRKTPLLHLLQKKGKRFLRLKLVERELEIPVIRLQTYHTLPGHERLTCDSCHSGWAPQCYGCHISFDPQQSQWDHLEKKKTKGRWIENRWHITSKLPALGVTGDNKITTFVPGMNMTLQTSADKKPVNKIVFSALSPHTTQKKSRSCKSCHSNESALGFIQRWVRAPQNKNWKTPEGWIEKDFKEPGIALQEGARSLNREEVSRVQKVGICLQCHNDNDPIYLDFNNSLNLPCVGQKAN